MEGRHACHPLARHFVFARTHARLSLFLTNTLLVASVQIYLCPPLLRFPRLKRWEGEEERGDGGCDRERAAVCVCACKFVKQRCVCVCVRVCRFVVQYICSPLYVRVCACVCVRHSCSREDVWPYTYTLHSTHRRCATWSLRLRMPTPTITPPRADVPVASSRSSSALPATTAAHMTPTRRSRAADMPIRDG